MLASDKNKKKLLYINSYEQPVKESGAWMQHRIDILIPNQATTLKFGAAIYEAEGTMWVDDVSIMVKNKR